ncbi:MAG: amino acid--tRNA ligase-related protein [Acidimicrobiia bacterium]
MRVQDGGALDAPVAKFLSESEQLGLVDAMGASSGDLLLLAAGERRVVDHVLGTLRVELGRPPVNEGGFQFLWVVDFPLFEGISDDGKPIPAHHPFTMPHPDDVELLEHGRARSSRGALSRPTTSSSTAGSSASGSVRIHRPDVQARIFDLLGISAEEQQSRFGFLLDAFRYGAPPHAGFAFGIDRLTAILSGEENIREVIALPKTQSGADPLTGAPGPIDQPSSRSWPPRPPRPSRTELRR